MSVNQQPEAINFIQIGIENLALELSRPLIGISLLYPNKAFLLEKNRWVSIVTLWDDNKNGLKISPKMVDTNKREEVGVLTFEHVNNADKAGDFYKLSDKFSKCEQLQKMLIIEAGTRIETGVVIKTANHGKILICPNAMPNCLAIHCTEIELPFFEPEYSLDKYELENWKFAE